MQRRAGQSSIYFLSDLHMGDGTKADRFRYPHELMQLLDRMRVEPGAELVLLGDVLELWACELTAVLLAHVPVVRAILDIARNHRVTYVAGNHDALPTYAYLGVDALGLHIAERYQSPDGKLIALHGHQYDPFNQINPGPHGKIDTPASAKLAHGMGVLERMLGPVPGDAAAAMGDWIEHASQALAHVKEMHQHQSPGDRGYPADEDFYRKGAHALARGGIRWVVMGHTHQPEAVNLGGGRGYVNIGSWVSPNYPPTYGHYDGQRVRLLVAPEGAEYTSRKAKPGLP